MKTPIIKTFVANNFPIMPLNFRNNLKRKVREAGADLKIKSS